MKSWKAWMLVGVGMGAMAMCIWKLPEIKRMLQTSPCPCADEFEDML